MDPGPETGLFFLLFNSSLHRIAYGKNATITGLGSTATNCSLVSVISNTLAVSAIEVYPNPAKDNINIKLGTNQLHVESIEILDVVGRVLVQTNVGTQITLSIPSDKLKPGVYVIRFRGDTTKTLRVVIQ